MSAEQERLRTPREQVDSQLYEPAKGNDQQKGLEIKMEIQTLAILSKHLFVMNAL